MESRGDHRTRNGVGDGSRGVPGAPLTSGASPTAGAPGSSDEAWDPAVIFRPGQTLAGRFVIRRAIGRGGMGAVYAADDSLTKNTVALKAILPSLVSIPRIRDRFIEEVNTARGLHHPRIVTVFDLVAYEGGILYTMELLRGHTVRAFMRHHGRLALDVSVRILDEICDALEYAHQFTVHRDISPENIMLLQDRTVKLLDFGIAKPLELDIHIQTKGAMGKDYYMAPEQRRNAGNVDLRADIWSLGVTLFEMLTAEMPMGYESVRILRPDLPKPCEHLIQRAIAPLDERYASAHEFREDLRACVPGAASGAGSRGGKASLHKKGRSLTRRQMMWAGFAALPVVLGVGGLSLFLPRTSSTAQAPPASDELPPEAEGAPAVESQTTAVEATPAPSTPNFSGYWKGGEFAELFLDNAGPTPSGWVRTFQEQGERLPFTAKLEGPEPDGRFILTPTFPTKYDPLRVSDGRPVDRFKVEFNPDAASATVTVGFDSNSYPEESFAIYLVQPRGEEYYINVSDLKVVKTTSGQLKTTTIWGPAVVEFASEKPGASVSFELPVPLAGQRSVALTIRTGVFDPFTMYFDDMPFATITKEVVQPYLTSGNSSASLSYPIPIGQFNFVKDKYVVRFEFSDADGSYFDLALDQIILY